MSKKRKNNGGNEKAHKPVPNTEPRFFIADGTLEMTDSELAERLEGEMDGSFFLSSFEKNLILGNVSLPEADGREDVYNDIYEKLGEKALLDKSFGRKYRLSALEEEELTSGEYVLGESFLRVAEETVKNYLGRAKHRGAVRSALACVDFFLSKMEEAPGPESAFFARAYALLLETGFAESYLTNEWECFGYDFHGSEKTVVEEFHDVLRKRTLDMLTGANEAGVEYKTILGENTARAIMRGLVRGVEGDLRFGNGCADDVLRDIFFSSLSLGVPDKCLKAIVDSGKGMSREERLDYLSAGIASSHETPSQHVTKSFLKNLRNGEYSERGERWSEHLDTVFSRFTPDSKLLKNEKTAFDFAYAAVRGADANDVASAMTGFEPEPECGGVDERLFPLFAGVSAAGFFVALCVAGVVDERNIDAVVGKALELGGRRTLRLHPGQLFEPEREKMSKKKRKSAPKPEPNAYFPMSAASLSPVLAKHCRLHGFKRHLELLEHLGGVGAVEGFTKAADDAVDAEEEMWEGEKAEWKRGEWAEVFVAAAAEMEPENAGGEPVL